MSAIKLRWKDRSLIEDGFYVYRDTSTMSPEALPEPYDTVAANVEEYTFVVDEEEVLPERFYFRAAAFKDELKAVSNEVWIGNPANVLSPDSPTWLFGNGEAGFANTLGIDTLYTDTAGTTPVSAYGDTIALAGNLAPNGPDMVQSTAAARPTYGRMPISRVRNELVATDTLSTQSVTVTAAQRTLSFRGTGTVTLSGASTAGPLEGTGTDDIVELTFTPSDGTLTLTVTGDVLDAQLELGAARTGYQSVGTGRYDVTEQGVQSVDIAYLDSADDAFEWTLDAGTYHLFVAGEKGSLFLTVTHGGGTLSVGPAAITWTGGASTVLAQVIGQRYMILPVPRDEPFTDFEKRQLVAYAMARGCPGVWNRSGNKLLNGDFSAGTDHWTAGSYWTIADGTATVENISTGAPNRILRQNGVIQSGAIHIFEYEVVASTFASNAYLRLGASAEGSVISNFDMTGDPGKSVGLHQYTYLSDGTDFLLDYSRSGGGGGEITFDNLAVYELTLEGSPA